MNNSNSNGWPLKAIREFARTASGGTPKRGVPAFYNGDIPWVKSGELGDKTVFEVAERITKLGLESSSAKLFPAGTLCIALYGATVGKLGILGIEAATNQAVCGIFLPPDVDTRYMFRFLESRRRELIEQGKGGAQPNISQDIIRNIRVPVPPLDDQQRIVEEIEKQFTRVDAGVASLQQAQVALKRYRATVLRAACEGRLVPTEAELAHKENRSYEPADVLLQRILNQHREEWNGKGKYKEPSRPNIVDLPFPPEGWTYASVGQLGIVGEQAVMTGPFGTNLGREDFTKTGVPVLTISCLKEAGVRLEKAEFVSERKAKELNRY